MLKWRDWLAAERADGHPAGSWLVPARRSHLSAMRLMLAKEPCRWVHLASVVDPPSGEVRPSGGLWAMVREGRLVGALQAVRGISWSFSEKCASDAAAVDEVVDFIVRRRKGREVVLGPASEVEPVLEALSSQRRLRSLEIRRQEMLVVPFGAGLAASVGSNEQVPHGGAFTLRHSRPGDLGWLLNAHRKMCLEDLGTDQVARRWEAYRNYFRHLIAQQRTFIGEYDGRRVFKAEIAVVGPGAELIEGVITLPAWRGLGIARSAISEIVQQITARGARPCLYVQVGNVAARRLYERVGFSRRLEWRTALLDVLKDEVGAGDENE